ncbi:MAG TPA: thiamine pyrophosphate-binding protein [Bryobacteraceae bacterium]|nr:thiamine pyrophosphate-binding protein [Bryobacteraceae bacterium]
MKEAPVTQKASTIRIGGRRSGAWLARYALEQLPVSHTFGIPGVHNTELYDELSQSAKIRPVLVTHEACAAFAADSMSRTGGGRIGCLVIVPAAGVTHAMSGIGECYLDGIPLLVITGGVRNDVGFGYQLHQIDQMRLTDAVVKRAWRIQEHQEIVPVIFEAYRTAVSGVPGPVLVEIPVNVQLFQAPVDEVPVFEAPTPAPAGADRELDEAVKLLGDARSPGIFTGWGAMDVSDAIVRIAEILGAPVSTTLQGLSAFPGNHPLHTGMGFSRAAVPAAANAFRDCDCLLAVGVSFGEIPTGSYGAVVPSDLIHIDISPEAIGRNYPARVRIAGDARVVVPKLLARLEAAGMDRTGRRREVEARVAADKQRYREEWRAHRTDRVNPALFFEELRRQTADDAIATVDDGNHTYLAAELFEVRRPRTFISPTDFNCMGHAVPAAIGAKLANPGRQVFCIAGDGAFLMTGMEIVTAATLGLGIVFFVFDDGELSQIAQGQEIPYNRKTCTVLGNIRLSGIAEATGARYLAIGDDGGVAAGIREALAIAHDQPVIVDVRIDYSKRTRFTQGVVQTVLKRFPLRDRARFIARALLRKVTE